MSRHVSTQIFGILDFRQQIRAALDILVAGDEVSHFAVVELAVCDHIEVACAGEAEDDVFGFACFFAFEGFVDGGLDGVGGFGGGEDAFDAGEHLRGFEDFGLLDGDGAHQLLVVELGEDGAHAVIAKAAGVNRAGHEA